MNKKECFFKEAQKRIEEIENNLLYVKNALLQGDFFNYEFQIFELLSLLEDANIHAEESQELFEEGGD